jgi:predicted dienelactone hydrolase
MKKLLHAALLLLGHSAFAQFAIGHRTITYNDPSRNNRAIACEIYYPGVSAGDNVAVAAGEFPIIVFGHGFVMQPTAYPNWKNEFVPQGFIMVFPSTETGASPVHQEFGLDLRFLATHMQTQGTNNASPFFQHITDRTAIMGHSMGGGATILGASGFAGVDCIVGLAPAETNPSAVSAGSNVSAPALILSGGSDGVTPPADHHIPIYDGLASDCKYFVDIENGSHCYFASSPGLCSFGEFIPGSLSAADQREVSYAVCLPWFNYFLKDDCDAWDDFQTALSSETALGTINSVCTNDAPVISDNSGTLESDQQANYQWYLDGNEIPNADQQIYSYTLSGTYQVGTVILGNCPTFSNEIVVQITGIEEPEVRIELVANQVLIRSQVELHDVTVEWFDLSGRVMQTTNVPSVLGDGSFNLSKPSQDGIKLLRLRSEEVSRVWKVY